MGYLTASVVCNQQNCNEREDVVTIPLFLALSILASDQVSLGISVFAINPAAGSLGLPTRTSTQTIGTIRVPANGATTPAAVNVTI